MKFGETLNRDRYEIPSEWRPFLIQYELLKKSIYKIEHDLSEIGMSQEIVKATFSSNGCKLEYFSFKGRNLKIEIMLNN